MLFVDSRTVGMKGTNMTCKPLGARDPFPPGSPVMEVLLLSPCYRWGNKLGEVMSLAQVTQQYKASLGCLFVCLFFSAVHGLWL